MRKLKEELESVGVKLNDLTWKRIENSHQELVDIIKECQEVITWYIENSTPHNSDYQTSFNLSANILTRIQQNSFCQ